jgi:two-component system sensor kinase FixL
VLSRLSNVFINTPAENIGARIEEGLRTLVEYAGADRALLAQVQPTGRLLITHCYAVPGFHHMPRIIMDDEFPWVTAMLTRGQMLRLSSPNDLPAHAVSERHWMQQSGVGASLMIPFSVGGVPSCTLALESRRERQWADEFVPRIQLAGEILANALARQRAEITRRETEQRFRHLTDTAPVMVWMSGPDKQCIYLNQTWLHFTGRPLDRELGNGWADGVHPDDAQQCIDIYTHGFDARQSFEMEYRLRRFDGEYRWILDMGLPRFGSDGTFEGYMGTCIDITDRKRAEEDLRKSEGRLRMLLESTNAIPWVADGQSMQFTYVGPQATRLLGYPASAWLGKNFWVEHIYPDDRQAALAYCMEHSLRDRDYELDYRMIAADGRVVWIHDIVNVVREGGAPKILRGFLIDITQRKAADEELRGLREQLVRVGRVSLMGEFAASIAHEVNQPLCAIVSNALAAEQMLEDQQFSPSDVYATMRDISEDGRRASAVIAKMRNLFRQAPSAHIIVEMNELVRDVVALVHGEMVRRGVILKLELDERPLQVLADSVQLQQVILNLLTNGAEAMDAIPREQRELLLRSTLDSRGSVVVAVKDLGVGIDKPALEHVFDPFFTTKSGGMGMGLAICRSILSSHGGRLWLERNPDRGMTFLFSVPQRKENASS